MVECFFFRVCVFFRSAKCIFVPKRKTETDLQTVKFTCPFFSGGIWCSVFIVNNLQIFYFCWVRVYFVVAASHILKIGRRSFLRDRRHSADSHRKKFKTNFEQKRRRVKDDEKNRRNSRKKIKSYLIVRRADAANGIDAYIYRKDGTVKT